LRPTPLDLRLLNLQQSHFTPCFTLDHEQSFIFLLGIVDANQCASRKMDLVVIIDGTISIGYEPFAEQRDFVRSILSKMRFGLQATQLGIIQFSDKFNTAVEMDLGDHGGRAEVLRNVSNIKYQQGRRTMTGLAMFMANEQVII
jgi:hypothetical protein